MEELTAGKQAGGERQARSERPERSEGRESAKKSLLDGLERLKDGELNEVVKRCADILAAREKARRDKALEEIHKIAREHGLVVGLKRTPGRHKKAARKKPKRQG